MSQCRGLALCTHTINFTSLGFSFWVLGPASLVTKVAVGCRLQAPDATPFSKTSLASLQGLFGLTFSIRENLGEPWAHFLSNP